MIVTRGKNLFPEELESVLESHPAIGNASVHGVDDALRGRQVVAVIRWSSTITGTLPDAHELSAWCMQHLEAYKSPRQFLVSAQWCWTASGKSDHLALGTALDQHFSGASKASSPWLLPLR
jgi:acyl-CoA synthetase (AMP-forming)/AMP-acid ligase II